MRQPLRQILFPLIALMGLGLLAAGLFYKQNFDQGVTFPNLGNLDDSLDCNTIDRDRLFVILAVGQSNASNYGRVPFTPKKMSSRFTTGDAFQVAIRCRALMERVVAFGRV